MIDVSGENLSANPVKVERIIPLTDPETLNAIDARALKVTEQTEPAPVIHQDICRRHGLEGDDRRRKELAMPEMSGGT